MIDFDDRADAVRVASEVYMKMGAPIHSLALANGQTDNFDVGLVEAGIQRGRELQKASTLPVRLMAGLRTLTALIVVRIHGGKPA